MTRRQKMNGEMLNRAMVSYTSEDERWAAVVRRDAGADGAFYTAVKTTGIYCRPSCPARRPLRKNVTFYKSCDAAERAGFHPCKRCQPNGVELAAEYAARIAAACRTIELAEKPPQLEDLARAAAMSKFHFHRVFVNVTGLTPKAYAMARRAEDVRKALRRRSTVTEAIYAAGYNSNGRFYADAQRFLGMNPKRFKRGGMGETIHFAAGKCSLGSILVAASGKGLCAISLGEDAAQLIGELRNTFREAQLVAGDKGFKKTVAKVIRFVEMPKIGLDLPLDVRGTVFQRRVWAALRDLPAGVTTSYAELAQRIGTPKSVRAVAGACAANTLAVAIPCHRVVRTGGAVSGYRWGVERKRELLRREAGKD